MQQKAQPLLHRTININGIEIFYREAGPENAPVILLPHGYPSSSFQFRNFMPALADRWRLIAPDYPGFGYQGGDPLRRLHGQTERREIAIGLMEGLRENLDWFSRYQAYLREHRPPTLIVWGPQDGYMPEGAARAYLRDLPDAELHLLDGGHWALETNLDEIVRWRGTSSDGCTCRSISRRRAIWSGSSGQTGTCRNHLDFSQSPMSVDF
jgi:pimeloyl-ACP methyl ester carboxylesterase